MRGNLLRAVDADGEVRQRSYDVMNRVVSETLGDPARRTPLTLAQNVYDEMADLQKASSTAYARHSVRRCRTLDAQAGR